MQLRILIAFLALIATPLFAAPAQEVVREQRSFTIAGALARDPHHGIVMDSPCGDHGADEETTSALRADQGRIHATRISSTCPDTLDAKGEFHHDDHFPQRELNRETL